MLYVWPPARPPLGELCTETVTISADGSLVVKDFPSRDDPKYLEYLEKSFLAGLTKKHENPDLCTTGVDGVTAVTRG